MTWATNLSMSEARRAPTKLNFSQAAALQIFVLIIDVTGTFSLLLSWYNLQIDVFSLFLYQDMHTSS